MAGWAAASGALDGPATTLYYFGWPGSSSSSFSAAFSLSVRRSCFGPNFLKLNVTITDTSGSVTSHIVKNAPIPAGRSLVAIGGDHKIVLETTDKITVTSSASSSIDAIVSVLEIT